MARYIDRDIALQIIDSYANTVTEDGKVIVDAVRDIVSVITPTADVVEVKHGYWKYRPLQNPRSISYQMLVFCNNCTARFIRLPGVHFSYCPNCGARMDGDT